MTALETNVNNGLDLEELRGALNVYQRKNTQATAHGEALRAIFNAHKTLVESVPGGMARRFMAPQLLEVPHWLQLFAEAQPEGSQYRKTAAILVEEFQNEMRAAKANAAKIPEAKATLHRAVSAFRLDRQRRTAKERNEAIEQITALLLPFCLRSTAIELATQTERVKNLTA